VVLGGGAECHIGRGLRLRRSAGHEDHPAVGAEAIHEGPAEVLIRAQGDHGAVIVAIIQPPLNRAVIEGIQGSLMLMGEGVVILDIHPLGQLDMLAEAVVMPEDEQHARRAQCPRFGPRSVGRDGRSALRVEQLRHPAARGDEDILGAERVD
jgi:hypothetical protein